MEVSLRRESASLPKGSLRFEGVDQGMIDILRARTPDEAGLVVQVLPEAILDIGEVLAAIRRHWPWLVEHAGSVVVFGRASASLAQLARSIAVEGGPHGVRCNAVAQVDGPAIEDTIEAILFLLSKDASYVTGTCWPVGRA
jgi:hypothetical protein